jgi:hypothetical protein
MKGLTSSEQLGHERLISFKVTHENIEVTPEAKLSGIDAASGPRAQLT